jgi:long-chain fatty acid transport protein
MLLAVIAIAAVSATVCSSAYGQAGGGGIRLYEVGTPDMGLSGVGAGARAQDAATAYSNPAGMTSLPTTEMLLGGYGAFFDLRLGLNRSTASVPPGSTDGGGQAGGFVPGMAMYAVIPIGDRLRFGFAQNGVFGGSVDYDDNWVGRAFVTESTLVAMNFEPAMSYRICDWLSVGAGLNIYYVNMEVYFRAGPGEAAAKAKIEDAKDWAVGYTIGLMLEPRRGTRIGITYVSQVNVDLDGTFKPGSGVKTSFDAGIDFPQGINVAVYHELSERLALLFDAGWTDWSEFGTFKASAGPLSLAPDREWRDTWRVGFGAQYRFAERWLLRGGYSYDSSPVRDSVRLPDIPVGEQHRVSLGVEHNLTEHITLGFSYTLQYLGSGEVDEVSLPPAHNVELNGDYDCNIGHFFGATMRYIF